MTDPASRPRLPKLAYTIAEATAATGLSDDMLYGFHNAGRVDFIKAGRRTLIPADSLAALVASFPKVQPRNNGRRGRDG